MGGLGCGGQAMNTSVEFEGSGFEGSGILVDNSGYELLELEAEETSSCTIPYAVVETVHAALYMLIAVSSHGCYVLLNIRAFFFS